jgi:LPS export ABC transporter protein LptC
MFLLLALVSGCNRTAVDPLTQDFRDLPADQIMIDVGFVSTVEGVRTATLESDSVYVFSDSSVMHLRGVDLKMYDQHTGQQTAHLTAESGVLNNTTQAMLARGNVVLNVIKDGQKIYTPELNYDPSAHRVWSDSATRRVMPTGETLRAASFTADDQFKNVQMLRAEGATGIKIRR